MSNDFPARWRDHDRDELRVVGAALESLDQPAPAGARERVWAGVESGEQPSHAWPWATAALAAAAAVVVVVLLRPTHTETIDAGRVERLFGSVEIEGALARTGQTIAEASQVSTGIDGRALVRLHHSGTAYVAQDTRAAIQRDSIRLEHGSVVTSVRARTIGQPPFRVLAGDHEVLVIGTLFQVSHTHGHVEVVVRHGRVQVRSPQGTTEVGAGGSFSSRDAAAAPMAAEAIELIEGRPTMVVEPAPAPAPEPEPEPTPDSLSPPRPPPVSGLTPGRAVAPRVPAALPEPNLEPAPENLEPAAEQPDPPGPRTELAAYQVARAARARDLNEAIDRYEGLLSRHPAGVFAQEARLEVIECAMQIGAWKKATYHIDVFVDAYPTSERIAEVRFLRAEIARHNHDCVAAIPDYDAALESPRRVGDAMFFKAWCLLRHERPEEALPLLEHYLERFPVGRHAAEARERVDEIRALQP